MIKLYDIVHDCVIADPDLGCLNLEDYSIHHTSRQRGYLSRKTKSCDYPIRFSRGLKKFYYVAPCYDSSQYCYRVYFDITNPNLILKEVDK